MKVTEATRERGRISLRVQERIRKKHEVSMGDL